MRCGDRSTRIVRGGVYAATNTFQPSINKEEPMPTTQKAAPRPRATAAARARGQDDARKVDQISKAIEAAQKDLASIGGSLGTGVRDMRRDVSKMLRDSRRDLAKMRRAIQRDLDRIQKDLTSAAAATGPPRSSRATRTTRTARRQSTH
jgi:hypothetical protein